MDVQELAEEYRHKRQEELIRLAVDKEQLTEEARSALQAELSIRRVSSDEISQYRVESERSHRKEERREALKKFKARGRRWYGKANPTYDQETQLERFTTTVFLHWLGFPLIPLGTFRVRKKRSIWSSPIPIQRLPLDWEQILKVWVTAAAIVLFITWAVKIAMHFSGN